MPVIEFHSPRTVDVESPAYKEGEKTKIFFSCTCGIAQFLRTAEESEREEIFSSKQRMIMKSMLNTKNEGKLYFHVS